LKYYYSKELRLCQPYTKSEDAVVASELNLTRFSLRILHYGLQLSLSRLFVVVTPLLSSHDQTAD